MAHEIMHSFFNVIALISIRPSIYPSARLDINAFITIKIWALEPDDRHPYSVAFQILKEYELVNMASFILFELKP